MHQRPCCGANLSTQSTSPNLELMLVNPMVLMDCPDQCKCQGQRQLAQKRQTSFTQLPVLLCGLLELLSKSAMQVRCQEDPLDNARARQMEAVLLLKPADNPCQQVHQA